MPSSLSPVDFSSSPVDCYADVFIFPTELFLSRDSCASSAEYLSFKDFPSGMRSTQASEFPPIRVVFMSCPYLHIPRVSRVCFSNEVASVFPQAVNWAVHILRQDLFPQ